MMETMPIASAAAVMDISSSRICEVRRVLIARPEALSDAEYMREPVDRCFTATSNLRSLPTSAAVATAALVLVWIFAGFFSAQAGFP